MTNAHSTSINPLKQPKIKSGDVYKTNEGSSLTVIECLSRNKVLIEFNDKHKHRVFSRTNTIKSGGIKNPYHPSVCGVGFFGVGKFKATNNGRKTKIYASWHFMIQRCYTKTLRYSHYSDCFVCPEWHNFQTYAEWALENNLVEGWEVDKDLLIKGNKLYSPSTCLVVPHGINNSILKADGKRGDLPIGVDFNKGKYRARVRKNGKSFEVGYFDNPNSAFNAYKKAKEDCMKAIAEKWNGLISDKAYQALISWTVDIND